MQASLRIQAGRQSQAVQFFRNIGNVLITEFPNLKDWWGVQHSLDRYVGHDKVLKEKSNTFLAGETKIRLLDGNIYNYSPEDEKDALDKSLIDKKKIIHYKGMRKVFMFDYWNRYLNPS